MFTSAQVKSAILSIDGRATAGGVVELPPGARLLLDVIVPGGAGTGTTPTDAEVASLVNTTTSGTRGALSATFARAVRLTGMTGGADCTAALQQGFTDAAAAKVPLIIPAAANGLPYKCSAILRAWTGARIVGEGAVIDFQTDGTATGRGLFVGADATATASGVAGISDVRISGLWLISSNATSRRGVYGLLSLFDAHDVLLEDCRVGNSTAMTGGESVGIFTRNCRDVRIVRPIVQNTLADGIHLSRGTQRVVIDHPVVTGAQDDGVAAVSVRQDGTGPIYDPCRFIQINQPTVLNSTVLGSGVALVGAQDCTVIGGSVNSVPASAVIISRANYGGIIDPARNTITGLVGTAASGASGAVRIANADRTSLVGLDISNTVSGIVIIGSSRTRVTGCAVDSTSATDIGVYDDAASTRTNVSGCVLDGNTGGAILLQGTGSISTGANITA